MILEECGYAQWLDPEASPREVLPLLRPFDAEAAMKMWPVSAGSRNAGTLTENIHEKSRIDPGKSNLPVGGRALLDRLGTGIQQPLSRYASLRMQAITKKQFRFIDLFCGIGGMRLGFEAAGGECVFSCDWDKYSRFTYLTNFKEEPAKDIRDLESWQVPPHDILVAGFPCQPFSISGVSKKNSLGRPHGFADLTQGTLFFELKRLIRDLRPRAFVLENVKNLLNHDRGRTIEIIYDALETELGYHVYPPVLLNARRVVPQNRERVFIVGFREPRKYSPPILEDTAPSIVSILDDVVDPKYVLSTKLWRYLRDYAKKHKAAGNGFGFGLVDLPNGVARTLSARYYKDGSEILIPRGRKNPRRLTPRECARLMGFPESFQIPVSDTQAYKQFGNSVVVPVVEAVAVSVAEALSPRNLVDTFPYSMPRQMELVEQ